MNVFWILAALVAADVHSSPQDIGQLGQRAQLLLFEVVPLGSSPEAVKYRISGLRSTPEGDLETTFPGHPGPDSVRVRFAFQDGRLVCISYTIGRGRNTFRTAKLYLYQTFGKSYLKAPTMGRGCAWCVNEMSHELGAFVMGIEMLGDSTGVETGWRFEVGCPDPVKALVPTKPRPSSPK